MVDKKQPPGIRFRGVVVDHIRFVDVPAGAQKPTRLHYAIHVDTRAADTVAEVALTFRIVDEKRVKERTAGKPLDGQVFEDFLIEVRVTGSFEPDAVVNFPLDKFAKTNAVPLLTPFVREAVARITYSSRNGVVLLPPINVLALLEQSAAAEAAEAAQAAEQGN